jgi:putative protein-disulfide isomerase
LLQAAAAQNGIRIELHAGGMMMGPRRQPVTPALRRFVLPHDRRIAELTGQPFADAYSNGLLNDAAAVFDSEPPITAILAASLVDQGIQMLDRIQRAHFIEGRHISDPAVLEALAADLSFDHDQFVQAFAQCSGAITQQHVEHSRALLHQAGGAGFPTFAYETNGAWTIFDSARFLGHVPEWTQALKERTAAIKATLT